jgi:hypothetical protein
MYSALMMYLEEKSLMKRSWVEVRNLEMSLIQKNLVQKSL